jgi:hypothetical protein
LQRRKRREGRDRRGEKEEKILERRGKRGRGRRERERERERDDAQIVE